MTTTQSAPSGGTASRSPGPGFGERSVMIRSGRVLLLLTALAAATTARAQTPEQLPAPLVTAVRESDAPSPSPFTGPALPAPPLAPPAPTFAPAPLPGPYFEVDPLLDRPPLPPPGWFAEVDVGLVIPHVKNHLVGAVQLPGAANPDTVQLGSAPLDWTGFPRIEAGYRLPSGFGAFSLSYRFLDTDGSGVTLHSRLSLNEVGLDYGNSETSLWPNWDMKWTLGLRLLYAFFDSRAEGALAAAAMSGTVVEQRESNWYAGFGPHVGLELDRQIAGTGLAVVVRGTGTLYLGRLRQVFFETATVPGGAPLSTDSATPVSQAVPAAGVFAGFRWQPPQWHEAELYLGYQYEHWWDIGKVNNTSSTAELNVQGIFVRAEWHF